MYNQLEVLTVSPLPDQHVQICYFVYGRRIDVFHIVPLFRGREGQSPVIAWCFTNFVLAFCGLKLYGNFLMFRVDSWWALYIFLRFCLATLNLFPFLKNDCWTVNTKHLNKGFESSCMLFCRSSLSKLTLSQMVLWWEFVEKREEKFLWITFQF